MGIENDFIAAQSANVGYNVRIGNFRVGLNFEERGIIFRDVSLSFPKMKYETDSPNHINGSIDYYARTDGTATFEDRTLTVTYYTLCESRTDAMQSINWLLTQTNHRKVKNRIVEHVKSYFTNVRDRRIHEGFFYMKPVDVQIEQFWGGRFGITLIWTVYPLTVIERSSTDTIGYNRVSDRGLSMYWDDIYFGRDNPMLFTAYFELTAENQTFRFDTQAPAPFEITFFIEEGSATFTFNGSQEYNLTAQNKSVKIDDRTIYDLSTSQQNIVVAKGVGILKIKYTTEELLYV